MIKSIAHKGLRELNKTGESAIVPPDLKNGCLTILDVLKHAKTRKDLNIPGLRLHKDRRFKPVRWRVDVNGPWRITFEWENGEARKIDLVQDH